MHFSHDSTKATKGRLGDSSLEDWSSFLESSPGEKTHPLSRVSRLELIALSLHHLPGLVVVSIFYLILLGALAFAFIQLISWETVARDTSASSMAVSLSGSDLGLWKARRLYCSPSQPCDGSSPFSEDGPSNLRYEIQIEVELTKC